VLIFQHAVIRLKRGHLTEDGSAWDKPGRITADPLLQIETLGNILWR
jgi:hypothetical protein